MTQKQINRYSIIKKTLEGSMTVAEAAKSLGLSTRQIIRLRNGVKENDVAALIHKNQGRKPAHAISDNLKKHIVDLKKEKYKGANFTHFRELLQEHEQITISYTALVTLLKEAGEVSPKTRRRYKPHRRRKRKPQEGLLIQMDATPYGWFNDGKRYALHGAIDDATGNIVGLYMTKNECLQGYFETTRQIIEGFGVPVSIYADRHTIFLSTKAGKLTIEEQLQGKVCNDTQFGRAMKELGITLIAARSPQAKGRVERLWDTLQSRLPVEFAIRNICTIDDANKFLKEYVPKFNNMFSVSPTDTESAYSPLKEGLDLNNILCVKEKRMADKGGVFSFHGKHFKITPQENQPVFSTKKQINVFVSSITGVRAEYNGIIYATVPFIKSAKAAKTAEPKERKTYRPPKDHYYKYGQNLFKKLTYEDSDQDILEMLNNIFLRKYS
jgi:transposase